jgi:Transmembrane amino acid transporter protein
MMTSKTVWHYYYYVVFLGIGFCCQSFSSNTHLPMTTTTSALVMATNPRCSSSTTTTTISTSTVRSSNNSHRHRLRSWSPTSTTLPPPLAWSTTVTATPTTTTTALQLSGGAAVTTSSSSSSPDTGGTATIPNEVFNLVKSIVGAGVLSLPWGVAVFGNAPSALIPAISLIAAMGILSAYTFGLMGRICQRTNTQSYSAAWDVAVGKEWSPLIAFSCFIDCFAGNLSYSMILADTIQNLVASAGYSITRTNALLGVTSMVLLPLCLLKNLASLAPFSLVGIMGMLYTTAAMGIRYFGRSYSPGGIYYTSQLAAPVFGTAGASAALHPSALILACMLSNAYIAHFNAPKFLQELKNNTMSRFHQVIAWSFGTSIALYGLITAFGFLTFGTCVCVCV